MSTTSLASKEEPSPKAVHLAPFAETMAYGFSAPKEDERTASRRYVLRSRTTPRALKNDERPPGLDKVFLLPEGFDVEHEACFVSAPVVPSLPFRDLLVSWNVETPPKTGFQVEVRVGSDQAWSPWMFVGDWGDVPALDKNMKSDGGKVDTDFFRGERTFVRAQFRVRAYAMFAAPALELGIDRVTLCFSDRTHLLDPTSKDHATPTPGTSALDWKRRLDVPFRSQKTERPEIAGRICSPTSLTMVLAYRGVDRSTGEVAARAYDAPNDIFGNWPENIQAAYSFGVPGYLTRFTRWSDVEREIAKGQPVIASIAVKEGQLAGAPYKKTDGHLIVLTGFDDNGDCFVNDPAVTDPAEGKRLYKRSDMQTVWLDRGGTAYILEPKP